MGLFSFFSKKSPLEKPQEDLLRGQAYDTTVAAPAPVLGTYPVAGNGPNVLDQLQRAARKRSEVQPSQVEPEATAPAPSVPRSRGKSLSRPKTAPGPAAAAERPKSQRLSRVWPFLSEPSNPHLSAASFHSAELPPVPSIAHHYRNSSATSIDVLDAQDSIRQYSFRSRIEANGTRDYGEDVAERNLGLGGLSALSALSAGHWNLRQHGSATDMHSTYYTDASEEIDESAPPPVIARGELSKEERANRFRGLQVREPPGSRAASFNMATLRSLSRDNVTERGETWSRSAEKRPETHDGAHSSSFLGAPYSGPGRRRSLNAFASAPSSSSQKERHKPTPLSLDHSQSNFVMGPLSPPPLPRYQPLTPGPLPPRPRSSISTVGSLDSIHIPKHRNESRPHTRNGKMSKSEIPDFSSPVSYSSRSSRYHSHKSSMASSRRHSSSGAIPLFGLESLVNAAFDDAAPSPQIASFSKHAEPQILSRPDGFNEWSPHYGSARGEHSYPLARPSSSSSHDPSSNSRRRSVGGGAAPVPGRPKLDDITEHIPIRTSSLNHGQASVTPTTLSSRHSSNPFLRPQSQHTTNTSIDLSIPVPQLKLGSELLSERSITSLASAANPEGSTYVTAAEDSASLDTRITGSQASLGHRSRKTSFGSRLTHDPISEKLAVLSDEESDTGSVCQSRQRVRGGEEGLLFDEVIYGDGKQGLPGLFDMFSGLNSPPMPETPTSPDRPFSGSNHSTPGRKQRQPRLRHSQSTPIYSQREETFGYGSSSDESDSFSDFDVQLPRGRPVLRFQDFERNSTYGRRDVYDFIQEEDEKMEISSPPPPKLTKKSSKRVRRANPQTTQWKPSLPSKVIYDEGNTADMEC